MEAFTPCQTEERPWGSFSLIRPEDHARFISLFFPGLFSTDQGISDPISCKFLHIKPGARLSWQYHRRRHEVWRVINGPVSAVISETNYRSDPDIRLQEDDILFILAEQRHRLIGLDTPAVVAEVWIHTDPNNMSDEADIVRIEDDFARSTLNN